MRGGAPQRVQPVETVEMRSNPKDAGSVPEDGIEIVDADAVPIVRVVQIRREGIAVISEQAIIGGKPHVALIVLCDTLDPSIQPLAVRGKGGQADIPLVDDGKDRRPLAALYPGGGTQAGSHQTGNDGEEGESSKDMNAALRSALGHITSHHAVQTVMAKCRYAARFHFFTLNQKY